mmetsp:Transcript_33209/g.46010  ORF Transcript_33209/g.46010 Transcript_33209/m.46010 type:complete len:212 (+) Transcript_33209:146-781(+)|eukprot:CAMPEP_0196583156 /NCGR_PEP_ID=MMETSP1081-20130531/42298_1 /TAXON_ID=36882 /ORGANISM="Pyramimonas amylifera, Strain CCMP720" /LENGTH=211 /DNA_ID=CAMNT_0041903957 /DNA_START=128 /DNA_END=763 /DNA_ORIENTATION=-
MTALITINFSRAACAVQGTSGKRQSLLFIPSNARSASTHARSPWNPVTYTPNLVVRFASGGKGFSNSKTGSKKQGGGKSAVPAGWEKALNVEDFTAAKKILPFSSQKADFIFMLYDVDGDIFCTEAESTAFKFPLSDAEVFKGVNGPAIRVPLDGTSYDLNTGAVIEWCPKDNPIRNLLGSLKAKVDPVPLRVFETKIGGNGDILIRLQTK